MRADEKLDGKYLLSCTDDNIADADATQPHKSLLEAERSFRDLKQVLELRPVYHRHGQRIRAHITLCYLALMLIRVAENATGTPRPVIARTMDRMHGGQFTGPGRAHHPTHRDHPEQRTILRALNIPEPAILLDHDLSPQVTAPHRIA